MLPIRTTLDDAREVTRYLATKPTGASLSEARAVLDGKRLDSRKLNAYRLWGLIEDAEGRFRLTEAGRRLAKGGSEEVEVLLSIIRGNAPYSAIVERAAHRQEDSLDTNEVGAHWHEHFRDQVSESEKILKDQAVCFFHVAQGAGLGNLIAGRKGNITRFSFLADALRVYVSSGPRESCAEQPESAMDEAAQGEAALGSCMEDTQGEADDSPAVDVPAARPLGQGIFVAHGKNKKPLDQLKKILEELHITYRVAVEEPNLGRPISAKIRDILYACNCAILIFTADEEFRDADGNPIWRPSENVVYELGATGLLYDNRIVILKEEKVNFPSNFRDIGHISFDTDKLEAKAMDILKELVGFGIVRIST